MSAPSSFNGIIFNKEGPDVNIELNLKVACQDHEVYLHIYHLSGDRMIKTGLDGRSRGDLDAGVSLGHDVRLYLPLDKGAFQLARRSLEEWCK